jgi:hypothetical protein
VDKVIFQFDASLFAAGISSGRTYISKYVQAYARHGVSIDRIVVQNETDMNPGYIRPQFKQDGLKTEIWAGTFRGINRQTGEVTYNADFAPLALMSRFIRPGDQLLQADIQGGRVIVVRSQAGNDTFVIRRCAQSGFPRLGITIRFFSNPWKAIRISDAGRRGLAVVSASSKRRRRQI